MKEIIFIGLPGPTHNYGGLAHGNVASSLNAKTISNPKEAAHQAITLMETLITLGIETAILPPQLRPHIPTLEGAGYSGTPQEIIEKIAADKPELLSKLYSSAAMWVANAATIAPSIDTVDGKLHITPANLATNLHRAVESEDTHRVLAHIFKGRDFIVHNPLPAAGNHFADEGAANHIRLAPSHDMPGLNIFVYGRDGNNDPAKFPARQSLAASEALARLHGLKPNSYLFIKQNPEVIDAGVFHNDVISVGNGNVLLYHERAFADGEAATQKISAAYSDLHSGQTLHLIKIAEKDLSVEDAIKTYFFNSQIVTLAKGEMTIIAPKDAEEHSGAKKLMEAIVAGDNPITAAHYLDLRQSMRNGGGPACLRLRAPMTEEELNTLKARHDLNVFLTADLISDLKSWVDRHYSDKINPADLANPDLYGKSEAALTELGQILKAPVIGRYSGQKR